jgi:hypothetical protein
MPLISAIRSTRTGFNREERKKMTVLASHSLISIIYPTQLTQEIIPDRRIQTTLRYALEDLSFFDYLVNGQLTPCSHLFSTLRTPLEPHGFLFPFIVPYNISLGNPI